MVDWELFRKEYQAIPIDERGNYLKKLSSVEQRALLMHPKIFLDDKQIPPETSWRYHWFRGGRGTGKTFASTSWLFDKIISGAQEVAIVGPGYPDLIKEILPTFEKHFPPEIKPNYNGNSGFNTQSHMYELWNGCIVKVYSSDTEIRGCNPEYGIAEEVCKWCDSISSKISERFTLFDLALRNKRANPCPQIFISSTPKPIDFFINFEKEITANNPLYSMIRAKMEENNHLHPDAKKAMRQIYGHGRLGQQELDAELLTDNPNALWTAELIDKQHIQPNIFHEMITREIDPLRILQAVIAVDPAVSTGMHSDETGIIVGLLLSNNKVYILEDCSGKFSPSEWARIAVDKYKQYNASHVLMESNQGGNLLEQNIKSTDRYVRTKLIHTTVSKQTRFEPVVAAYERGEVFHVGELNELEKQMLSFNPYVTHVGSPDRADAMAYCVYELLLGKTAPVKRNLGPLGRW